MGFGLAEEGSFEFSYENGELTGSADADSSLSSGGSTETTGSTSGLVDTDDDSSGADSGKVESDTIDQDFYENNSPWEDPDISNEEIEQDLLNRDPAVDTSVPDDEVALDPDQESAFTGESPGTVVDNVDGSGIEPDVSDERAEENLGAAPVPDSSNSSNGNSSTSGTSGPSVSSSGDLDKTTLALAGAVIAGVLFL